MPAKLRKMLCDINHPTTVAMMRLIETQSQRTLTDWAVSYAQQHYLPIYQRRCEGDDVMAEVLRAARGYLEGTVPLKDVKPLIKAARLRCGELTDPVALAAGRAISTACAVCTTATNALGYLFYGAAALAYDQLGVSAAPAEYDAFAEGCMENALAVLQAVAVADEPNPAKIDWNC